MEELYSEFETPCFILDEIKLEQNYKTLKEAFESNWSNQVIIGYSVKTNSLPWIIGWMYSHGAYIEVVSKTEYELARSLSIPHDKIILNGPVKEDILEESLKNDTIVNLDNFAEIEWIRENIHKFNSIKVGLRINFDLEAECPNETVIGTEPGRFGFNIENGSFEKAIRELSSIQSVKICGLHLHHSTKTRSLKIFKTLCEKAGFLSELFLDKIEYVDIGGCLLGDKPGAPSYEEYAQTVVNVLKAFPHFAEAKIIIEPGACLIASPFTYLCRVINERYVKGNKIVTTDGTLLHVNPMMHDINFQFEIKKITSRKVIKKQIIAGYTCIEKDRFRTLIEQEEIVRNDFIFIKNTGAYSITLGALFINYFPNIYVLTTTGFKLIRKKWTIKNFLQNNEVFK